MKKCLSLLLVFAGALAILGQGLTIRSAFYLPSIKPSSVVGVSMQNPSNIVGNWEWIQADIFFNDADGKTVNPWTNSASSGGPNMYSYAPPLYTNNLQNGMGAVYSAGALLNFVLYETGSLTLSNYFALIVAKADGTPDAGDLLIAYTDDFYLAVDDTRSAYMVGRVNLGLDGNYYDTNQIPSGPFVFGMWRQGPTMVTMREYGPLGTNTIDAQQNTSTHNFGVGGHPFSGGNVFKGWIYESLVNTNASLDLTNALAVMNWMTNKWAVHP